MMMENAKGDMDDESDETQLFFDMLMMVLVTGKERNEKEWTKLIFSAGFSDNKITPLLGLRSLIEAFPGELINKSLVMAEKKYIVSSSVLMFVLIY
ncbi:hypothetical protein K1719_035096 [Acacia pycnantha]|nr:hypothetical protein K1719_035096 [Acacia pycnantha]